MNGHCQLCNLHLLPTAVSAQELHFPIGDGADVNGVLQEVLGVSLSNAFSDQTCFFSFISDVKWIDNRFWLSHMIDKTKILLSEYLRHLSGSLFAPVGRHCQKAAPLGTESLPAFRA